MGARRVLLAFNQIVKRSGILPLASRRRLRRNGNPLAVSSPATSPPILPGRSADLEPTFRASPSSRIRYSGPDSLLHDVHNTL